MTFSTSDRKATKTETIGRATAKIRQGFLIEPQKATIFIKDEKIFFSEMQFFVFKQQFCTSNRLQLCLQLLVLQ